MKIDIDSKKLWATVGFGISIPVAGVLAGTKHMCGYTSNVVQDSSLVIGGALIAGSLTFASLSYLANNSKNFYDMRILETGKIVIVPAATLAGSVAGLITCIAIPRLLG